MNNRVEDLVNRTKSGNRTALAKLLTIAERGGPQALCLSRLVNANLRHSYIVGITGPPGVGKSTLTNALLQCMRQRNERVAILAIDPSSNYSGGAILGDRLRIGADPTDNGAYIRSMANRGALGGLSVATPLALRVLDLITWDWIIVETVGVGQSELDIIEVADIRLVLTSPGLGDEVQHNKAGLMEIADIFVLNKADMPGAEQTKTNLLSMLSEANNNEPRRSVVETVATDITTGHALYNVLLAYKDYLLATDKLSRRRSEQRRSQLIKTVRALLDSETDIAVDTGLLDEILQDTLDNTLDYYSGVEKLIQAIGKHISSYSMRC